MAVRANTKKHTSSMGKGVLEKIVTLIIAAFSLVAALAWNAAIQSVFAYFFGTESTVIAELSYAVIVTVIAVIVTIYLSKLLGKDN